MAAHDHKITGGTVRAPQMDGYERMCSWSFSFFLPPSKCTVITVSNHWGGAAAAVGGGDDIMAPFLT